MFVGPGPIRPHDLNHILTIRKKQVWRLLSWLKQHNELYASVPLSMENLDMYHEDGTIPGLQESIIHDAETDPKEAFLTETAGHDEHPAELVQGGTEEKPLVHLETSGVSDPEGDSIPARTLTAVALRKFATVAESSSLPDLAIQHSKNPISDYSNPSLFPGMFPTLFPYGIGGFEDPTHPTPISFDRQAEYYLDIEDRCFRYHKYFMFVALHIKQKRAAHLHTSFTVKKPYFEQVAQTLLSVSSKTLEFLQQQY